MSTLELVSARELVQLVPMSDAIAAVREAFILHARGEFVAPLRTSFDDGGTLVMPVFHSPSRSTATKSVLIRLGEQPAVRGMVSWISDQSELVLDAHAVTALRTGAVVGVATDLLARPDAKRMVLIGAGTMALAQVQAVLAVREIDQLCVVSRTAASAEVLSGQVRTAFPSLMVVADTSPRHHLATADIVCCATSAVHPVFDASELPEQVHINAIGSYTLGMRELPVDAFTDADVVVDELGAASSEAGDLAQALSEGTVRLDDVSELGRRLDAAAGFVPAGRSIFKSVGLGLQDWAIAHAVANRLLALDAAQ